MQKIIIVTTKRFDKDVKKLQPKIYQKTKERIKLFIEDRKSPLLAVHKLHGEMDGKKAFSVTGNIRVIFMEIEKNDDMLKVVFEAVGPHPHIY